MQHLQFLELPEKLTTNIDELQISIRETVLLYTYCDTLPSNRKDKSRLLQVKFDPDWSDDCSH